MAYPGFAEPTVDGRENALPDLQIEPRPHAVARFRDHGGRRLPRSGRTLAGVDQLGGTATVLGELRLLTFLVV